MCLSDEFSEEARRILKILHTHIPFVVDHLYAVAHDLAERGYRYHSTSSVRLDSLAVDGCLQRVMNEILADNPYCVASHGVNSLKLAQRIGQAGVYHPDFYGHYACSRQDSPDLAK